VRASERGPTRLARVDARVQASGLDRACELEREGELICCTRAPSVSFPLIRLVSSSYSPPLPLSPSLPPPLFSAHPNVQIPRPESATGLNAARLANADPSIQRLCLSPSPSLSPPLSLSLSLSLSPRRSRALPPSFPFLPFLLYPPSRWHSLRQFCRGSPLSSKGRVPNSSVRPLSALLSTSPPPAPLRPPLPSHCPSRSPLVA